MSSGTCTTLNGTSCTKAKKDTIYALVHEAVLREPLDDWRLPTLEARLGLAVPRTRLLALVAAPGGLAETGAAATTKTFLLQTATASTSRATSQGQRHAPWTASPAQERG